MDVLYERVCGLDVHKLTVVACVRCLTTRGKVEQAVRTFGTTTAELLALSDWLQGAAVSHVAMESTGVFWKPIYNILEGRFKLLLVNAQHIKQVPGRKTDVADSQWIAQLLQCGLLRGSFVPPQPIRELRDLVRHRATLVQQKGSVGNRIQKVLEDANIKLASVASDVLGVSGRAMIKALLAGEQDAATLADLARRRLRRKIPELRAALTGRLRDHHRFQLQLLFCQLEFIESQIDTLSARVADIAIPLHPELKRLRSIPGIEVRTAENLIAEIGADMGQFPTAGHLASWAGICPGNQESAGKRKSGKTPKANRGLRRALTEAAWAASHTKNTYFTAQYRRIAARRGKKRAIVAVGHTILTITYHLLRDQTSYADLGPDYFERLNADRLTRYHVRKLEALGYDVTIKPPQEAA
jgi:transposase